MQTRVPPLAERRAKRLAAEAGISAAAWLRRLILSATGVNGRGKRRARS